MEVDLPAGVPFDREWQGQARMAFRRALRDVDALADQLFEPLLHTGVLDPDPSHNRLFVEAAVTVFGRRRVQAALIGYVRSGTDSERAGAARAWYWAQAPLRFRGGQTRVPTPGSKAEFDAVADLRAAWHEATLRAFVDNDDLDVRRCILPGLPLNPRHYPAELHALVAEAVHIARTHPDEYLRHRVEHQVG
ncbi:hypothetical protein AQJ67_15230 [Streptomyces caeruleatus]|uniref:Uncharacterized protein n=2 Tax=Streptomyces caeruleatus TaxID=661399 RepID=A0A101U3Z2_9ACTN|nr:hypothetical protein AQJ67_15230 [Streptomyces caeruleatus]